MLINKKGILSLLILFLMSAGCSAYSNYINDYNNGMSYFNKAIAAIEDGTQEDVEDNLIKARDLFDHVKLTGFNQLIPNEISYEQRDEAKRVLAIVYFSLGVYYFQNERFSEAVDSFSNAFSTNLKPHLTNAQLGIIYVGRALSYKKIGKETESSIDFEVARSMGYALSSLSVADLSPTN